MNYRRLNPGRSRLLQFLAASEVVNNAYRTQDQCADAISECREQAIGTGSLQFGWTALWIECPLMLFVEVTDRSFQRSHSTRSQRDGSECFRQWQAHQVIDVVGNGAITVQCRGTQVERA